MALAFIEDVLIFIVQWGCGINSYYNMQHSFCDKKFTSKLKEKPTIKHQMNSLRRLDLYKKSMLKSELTITLLTYNQIWHNFGTLVSPQDL